MARMNILGTLLLASTLAACAATPDEEEDGTGDSTEAVTARDITFKQVAFDPPAARAHEENKGEVFDSIDRIRTFFGESCGWFCTTPFEGTINFTIPNKPDKRNVAAYINRPDVPAGHELVITSVRREGNPKWLYLGTCVRPARVTKSAAMVLVEVDTTLPILWASAPEGGQGVQACR